MNNTDLRGPGYETKREDTANNNGNGNKAAIVVPKANLTTSSWSRLKDPRIVRVSRAFGGKDRHSKVCTVRGLRDRRVRLSVPTAIQLYDLQDRLGLNQPSKVVDWLLDAAKNEIDELPPLQIPPGIFGQNLQAIMLNNASSQNKPTDDVSNKLTTTTSTSSNGLNWEDYWNPDKSKAIVQQTGDDDREERDQEEAAAQSEHHDIDDHHGTFAAHHHQSSSNFFGRNPNSSNLPGLLNNVVPINNTPFLKWDPSNLSLSQFGRSYGSSSSVAAPHRQADADEDDRTVDNFNRNVAAALHYFPPPPTPQTQSYFPPPSHNHNSGDHRFDPKQLNFQMMTASPSSPASNFAPPPLYTINQGMGPLHLSMNPKFFSSQYNNGGDHEPNK